MKTFFAANWYKIAVAFSLVTFSLGFLIYSLRNNVVQASPHIKQGFTTESNYPHVIALPDGRIFGVYRDDYNRWKDDYLTDAK